VVVIKISVIKIMTKSDGIGGGRILAASACSHGDLCIGARIGMVMVYPICPI
jgi:hypothetical protein